MLSLRYTSFSTPVFCSDFARYSVIEGLSLPCLETFLLWMYVSGNEEVGLGGKTLTSSLYDCVMV